MKYFTLIILVLLASGIIPVRAQADLAGLWEMGLRHPEEFDNYVSQNRRQLKENYNECLKHIFNTYYPKAVEEVARCKRLSDYKQAYMDCTNNSPATFAVVSAQTLYQVINGQARWVDTTYGQSALQVKQMAPYSGMNYDTWVQLYMSFAGQILQCP